MKYFLGFLVCIALVVGVFILVLKGFSGTSAPKNQNPLSNYADTNTTVQLTVDGPIVADSQHQAYRISVGRDQTTLQVLQGYDYAVSQAKVYPNNQAGYDNFLRALDIAGFAKGDTKSENKNERGVCADGDRFIFEIVSGTSGSDIQRYWSTSCSGKGNFKGDTAAVKQLFGKQIPRTDFKSLINGLNL